MIRFIDKPSATHSSREGAVVDMLVLHYTGMRTAEEAIDRLVSPQYEVSAHYLVDEDGTVYAMVPESEKAWHAGVSHWRGREGVNAFSIGIEIVNPGHEFGYRPFPKSQMLAVAELCQGILSRHAIPARNVVAHSDVAPARKEDPGELFDWPYLASQGIGLWPAFPFRSISNINLLKMGDKGEKVASMQRRLREFGYGMAETGEFDLQTQQVVVAFARHFRPEDISGIWDPMLDERLDILLSSINS